MKRIHDRDRLALPEQLAGIDLNLVLAFDALAREGSVTRAASRLGVTQSALSHSLRRLRDVVGDPILVRAGNRMVLTPRAEELVVPLRSGLVTLGRALFAPSGFDKASAQRSFCLATPDLFDVLVMPPLLARVGVEAPGVDLKLIAERGPALSEKLVTGEVDLAVVPRFDYYAHASPVPESPGLLQRTLFRDRFVCLMRANHPLLVGARSAHSPRTAERAPRLTLAAYLALSHALVSPRGSGFGPVDEALARRKLRRRVALSVPHFTSAVAIVARSDLVLTAPSTLGSLVARQLDLVALPPPLPLPEHTVNAVWHERFSNDAGHRWLLELVFAVSRQCQAELAEPVASRQRSKRADKRKP